MCPLVAHAPNTALLLSAVRLATVEQVALMPPQCRSRCPCSSRVLEHCCALPLSEAQLRQEHTLCLPSQGSSISLRCGAAALTAPSAQESRRHEHTAQRSARCMGQCSTAGWGLATTAGGAASSAAVMSTGTCMKPESLIQKRLFS